MIYLTLFLEFFKVGLFAIGGGLATIPFLSELGDKYAWFTHEELSNMIAISESTPGPIGINMATYVGYKVAGPLGGVVATLSEVMPAVITLIIIAGFINKFKENMYVKYAFEGIRPIVFGLILTAFLGIFTSSVIFVDKFKLSGLWTDLFNIKTLAIFLIVFLCNLKWKIHPIFYVLISAVLGILLFSII